MTQWEDFVIMTCLCPDADPEHPSSSWMVEGQRILLGATTEEMAKLSVTDIVVPFEVL